MDLGRRIAAVTAERLVGLGFWVVLLGAWQIVAVILPDYMMPGPWHVLREAWRLLTVPELLVQVGASIVHVLASLILAFLLGGALVLLATYVPVLRLAVLDRLNGFLNSFSSIGWTMLGILWFGLHASAVIFVITAVILPIVVINLQAGLDAIEFELLEMGASFTRRRLRVLWAIVLPSLTPFAFAALRIGFGIGWKVALTAELFGGNSGLGFLVNLSRQALDTAQIFAVIGLIVLISVAADALVFAPAQRAVARQYAHE